MYSAVRKLAGWMAREKVSPMIPVTMTVNRRVVTAEVEPRTLLVDFLFKFYYIFF